MQRMNKSEIQDYSPQNHRTCVNNYGSQQYLNYSDQTKQKL